MKLTIHRGTHEVGGTCIEVSTDTTRVILDVGLPLFDENREALNTFELRKLSTEQLLERGILRDVPGLFGDGPRPDAILLSHAHLDHTGLLEHSHPDIPVYASTGTSKMMLAGKLFANQVELSRERYREVIPEQPIRIGSLTVTGYPVDHSIYGCLAFVIEGDGKRILYTGDLRSHGRKPGMERRLIEVLKDRPLDAMIMEGTHFSFSDGNLANEYELEDDITKLVQDSESLVLASFSPQHVDRLVAFIRAAKKTGRTFVADVYTAFITHLLKNELPLPQPEPNGLVQVYVPEMLRTSVHHTGRIRQIERFKDAEITLSEIRKSPEKYLMVFRASMLDDFDGELPTGTSCLYSRWHGYMEQPEWRTVRRKLEDVNGELHEVHTSGHMFSEDIIRFVREINPKVLIPVHTFEPESFQHQLANVINIKDGELFTIA